RTRRPAARAPVASRAARSHARAARRLARARRRCRGRAPPVRARRRAQRAHPSAKARGQVADAAEIGDTSRAVSEEIWIPLVDEPIGSIVEQLQRENPDLDALVSSPRRILAFRTFAYIRVGVLLGRLLVDNDVPEYDGSETWVETLLRDDRHRAAVVTELRAVAE